MLGKLIIILILMEFENLKLTKLHDKFISIDRKSSNIEISDCLNDTISFN